ncbi:hypothetical protein O7A05_23605 [Mesorhizobium sp. Cs1330R2N1]|uniref:Antitoxin n=1 Tax=Mesorhizobium argentiipisi TaxID=3015175 RepID=A0ABU8KHE2_9HYPH
MSAEDRRFEIGKDDVTLLEEAFDLGEPLGLDMTDVMRDQRLAGYDRAKRVDH